MYDYSGIVYRLWGQCGIAILLGLMLVISYKDRSSKGDMGQLYGGIALIAVALIWGARYCACLIAPDVQSVNCTFLDESRNSRIAPPLPFTMQYIVQDESGEKYRLYLDVISKKDIFPEDFCVGEQYVIYFESETDIIVAVDRIAD